MIPVTTNQGLGSQELKGIVKGRCVLIWGTSELALDTLISLRRTGFAPRAFLKTNPAKGEIAFGLPVLSVDDELGSCSGRIKPFVVIATRSFLREAEHICREHKLEKNRDYVNYFAIPRPEAIVELVSPFNDANVGEPDQTMSLNTFKMLARKLLSDQPLLVNITLGLWEDPLLNPFLPQIVEEGNRFAPCTVNTPLCNSNDLESLLSAVPRRIDIVTYGYADKYEQKNGSGSWSRFLVNLEQLKSLLSKSDYKTPVALKYIRLKGEHPHIIERWKEILEGSGIRLSVEIPYVEPYDHVLHYCTQHKLTGTDEIQFANLTWDIDRALHFSALDKNSPCLCQRIFPVVNADLSIGVCHLYRNGRVGGNYLNSNWCGLLKTRSAFHLCELCQEYGLHRLDVSVLMERYSSSSKEISERSEP